jgi:thiol-disulfide isomerase/thioredoxin
MKTVTLGIGISLRRWFRLTGLIVVIAFSLTPAVITNTGRSIAQSQNESNFEDELQRGRDLMRRHQYEEALKAFKHANELRDKKSALCFLEMAAAYQGLQAYKNVVESCEKVLELETKDNSLRARACNMEGLAYQSQSEGKDQKRLQQAEAAFRQGLALGVDLPILRCNLGIILLQQNRDAEGIAELKKYLELEPRSTNADQMRKLIANPKRARENYTPDFSLTTSDGQYIASDDLQGKVVLLDFWGTWCAPCVASVPSLRSMYKRYEKEPAFVMISISNDSDAEKWRGFVSENRMVWLQYLDRDHKVQRAFDVRAFPTYILIDHEGVLRFRTSGFNSREGTSKIEDAIRNQLKLAAKAGVKPPASD